MPAMASSTSESHAEDVSAASALSLDAGVPATSSPPTAADAKGAAPAMMGASVLSQNGADADAATVDEHPMKVVDAGAPALAERWTTTWGTTLISAPGDDALALSGVMVRHIVHVSLGGARVRVRFSNAFGTAPLQLKAVHVALRSMGAAIDPASDRALKWNGAESVTIAQGELATSDPVELALPAFADLAVTSIFGDGTRGETYHNQALQTSYVAAAASDPGATDLTGATEILRWYFLDGVDVATQNGAKAVVALGDSITDGNGTSNNQNERWTDVLAKRAFAAQRMLTVVNEGYAGNQIVNDDSGGPAATSRFRRDVLGNAGVTHVIIFEGINDIGARKLPAATIIDGLRNLIDQAHTAGLKVVGTTLTPDKGSGYYTDDCELTRQTVNQFLRGADSKLDGVIDADVILRDPSAPAQLLPMYDCSDHLHPNANGYAALGGAIDLGLFQ